MNAQLKTRAPTVAEAREALAAHERELLEARRQNASARGMLGTHKANADEVAERECRRTIALSAKQIETLKEAIDLDKETIDAVLKRDRSVGNAKRLRNLEQLAGRMVSASAALEGLTIEWAAARAAAYQAAAEFESELSHCGMPCDPYLSVARSLDRRVEMLMFLETGGAVGRAPGSLETSMQLRESKRASLHHAAAEFRGVALRSARLALGLPNQEI